MEERGIGMNERERRKQELLAELARRFRESAKNLREVAQRIDKVAQAHRETIQRLEKAGQELREYVEADQGPLAFTYLEFLEFTSAEEFRKFKSMPTITAKEIEEVNWEELSRRLLTDESVEGNARMT